MGHVMKRFEYSVGVEWTGNTGTGTGTPKFARDSEISTANKPTIIGSAPVEFGGDGRNWAPEDFFVAAVSQCHMLTYLFLCSRAEIVVESYVDTAVGVLEVEGAAGGKFVMIELRPEVVISTGDLAVAQALHAEASSACYVGTSITCPVRIAGNLTKGSNGLRKAD
jgi:organic hydroperoxide reductase OsmC/OhrA